MKQSRRGFLKALGIGVGAVAIAGKAHAKVDITGKPTKPVEMKPLCLPKSRYGSSTCAIGVAYTYYGNTRI
jgi:hypothetical protein